MLDCRLQLEGVSFRYRNGHEAVRGVDLDLGPGIVGLLGPNGAGKSSLMRILATLARPSSGRVRWCGQDISRRPDSLRACLGFLPQDFGVYEALSAREFLAFMATVKGLPAARIGPRVDECLAAVGLAGQGDARLGGYSGGMRQRVGIAQALLNDPRVLIVDEPTVGLDPEERLRFRHLLTDLAGDRLILLSTHIVSDVEASAARLAVMAAGRLRFSGTPESLIAQAQHHAFEWTVPAERLAELRQGLHISRSQRSAAGVVLRVVAERAPSAEARPVAPDLEDAYLWLLKCEGRA